MQTDPISTLARIQQDRIRLDAEEARAMFDARLQGMFDQAIEASGMSRKRALRATRQVNESLGRQVRWGSA